MSRVGKEQCTLRVGGKEGPEHSRPSTGWILLQVQGDVTENFHIICVLLKIMEKMEKQNVWGLVLCCSGLSC